MLDYHMLKRENQIIKQENKLLRDQVISRASKLDKGELMQLVDLQRQRIDNLEREYDALVLEAASRTDQGWQQESKRDASSSSELAERLEASERRCQVLQEQIDQLTTQYARQIAQLKARMTEQGAQLLITAENGAMPAQMTPSLHRESGVLKKKTNSSARLEPIQNMRSSVSSTISHESYDQYSSLNTSAQKAQYSGRNSSQVELAQQFSASYSGAGAQAYYQPQSSLPPQRVYGYGQSQQSLPIKSNAAQQNMSQFYSQFQMK
ncbi:hypothetical protein FGO68_gene2615 [Halteria grandinella]|uniref:Uncharacterized protein n=1 Tax=Halteria grandinella TaxID=5974 RepID=A0A8J8NCW4_HALGN|nr:hypothetical protein FGO68_gene2615 [Halteria grandinella]